MEFYPVLIIKFFIFCIRLSLAASNHHEPPLYCKSYMTVHKRCDGINIIWNGMMVSEWCHEVWTNHSFSVRIKEHMFVCVERVLCFRQMKSVWPLTEQISCYSAPVCVPPASSPYVCVLAAGLWLGVIHHVQDEDEGGPLLWRVCLLSLCLSRCGIS